MLFNPIKHTKLETIEDIKNFSCLTNKFYKAKTYYNNNGRIFFVDFDNIVKIIPYRPEILQIMEQAGFSNDSELENFQNAEYSLDRYSWLSKIAEEENWNHTYQTAHTVAAKKGLKDISLSEKVQIREIPTSSYFYDEYDTNFYYQTMVKKFLTDDSEINIGTFIIIDNKTLLMCDNYGRTFLLKVKDCINDVANLLLKAFYKRNSTPEKFVTNSKPENEFTL